MNKEQLDRNLLQVNDAIQLISLLHIDLDSKNTDKAIKHLMKVENKIKLKLYELNNSKKRSSNE